MKTLLLGALSLSLVFAFDSAEADTSASEASTTETSTATDATATDATATDATATDGISASMALPINLGPTKGMSLTEQDNSLDESWKKGMEKYVDGLKEKFGITRQGDVEIIDISYPSFLNYVCKKCRDLQNTEEEKITRLITYISDLIKQRNMEEKSDEYFHQLFIVGDDYYDKFVKKEDDEDGEDEQDEDSRPTKEKCQEYLEFTFKQGLKNLTFQQRIKSLLILRKIAELELNDAFKVKSLNLVRCYLVNTGYAMKPLSSKPELHFTMIDDSKLVSIPSLSSGDSLKKRRIGNLSSLNHELSHLYHSIIAGPGVWHTHKINPDSFKYDDVNNILYPFQTKKVERKTKELLLNALDKKWQLEKEQIVDQVVDKIKILWKDGWEGDLEEILTIIGVAPMDIAKNERYRVMDRQNQSAEMNRTGGVYRLLHVRKDVLEDDIASTIAVLLTPSNITELLIEALTESGYSLYASGDKVTQDSPAMREAEEKFLTTFGGAEQKTESVSVIDELRQELQNTELITRVNEIEGQLYKLFDSGDANLIDPIHKLLGLIDSKKEEINKKKDGAN